MAYPS